jgi:hypothetical protein
MKCIIKGLRRNYSSFKFEVQKDEINNTFKILFWIEKLWHLTVRPPYKLRNGMSAIILNMEQYRKPNMFYKKRTVLFQNKQISILEMVSVLAECIYYFWKKNESINWLRGVEAYPYITEELCSMWTELYRWQGIFEKMHQCNWGEKREF